ncbi:MAG TPA: GNAT family N-acetyltransferase [Patescibacteria group bacterium]|nr:GNAT family N-acetyltransferase [Patescibacteria group bacterium]
MLIEMERGPATGRLEPMLPLDSPTRPRAVAVLDGVLAGRVWTDDAARPSSLLVIETSDGTVYGADNLTREAVADALSGVETKSGDLIFGFRGPDDPMRALVPAEPYWRGEAIDFTDRQPGGAHHRPDGVEIVPIDASLLLRTEWAEDTLHAFGSVERWEELGVGRAAVIGDELVAECLAGPRVRGVLEMGVITREAYRGRGYGTLVSRLVAEACEDRGDRVWWNANAGNEPSIRIARRIGFQHERQYELVALHAPLGSAGSSA